MKLPSKLQAAVSSDLCVLILIALARILIHAITNGQYGFHHDELGFMEEGRHLDFGYVAFPPFTPLIARLSLELFGVSMIGLRLFSCTAQGIATVLTGLMAKEFGATRNGQVVAALAATTAPAMLANGGFFMYTSFDYLWWVLASYFVLRLLKSDDPRWWIGVGVAVGMGMETKYTMGFLIAGMLAGLLLTPARRYLSSPWLWTGVVVSLAIYLPNLIWQAQHHFIHLDFLQSIHARDVARGWGKLFYIDQLYSVSNIVTVPIWLAGLYFYFVRPEGLRYRMMGWMYLSPFLLLAVTRARGYYLAPAYPLLLAAGAAWGERWVSTLPEGRARSIRITVWQSLAWSTLLAAAVTLPIAPVGSGWYHFADQVNGNFNMEIGWPEIVRQTSDIYHALPSEQRAHAGILVGDVGEAGAIDTFGPQYGLPSAFSGQNTHWLRGYPSPPPQTVIMLNFKREFVASAFADCRLVGRVANPGGLHNDITDDYRDIFVCGPPRAGWEEFWKGFHYYG